MSRVLYVMLGIVLGVCLTSPVIGASVWDAIGHDAWVDQPHEHYQHPVQPPAPPRGDCP